jgi:hypothetical protein
MLFVFRAETTIRWTATVGIGGKHPRRLGSHTVLHLVVAVHIGTDEIFALAVFVAMLAKVNTTLALDDLGRYNLAAIRAKTLRRAKLV